MKPVKVKPDIYWIGVNDRTTDLFEGLWSIEKEGVSYNSYLIQDEKTVVIDLTKELMQKDFLSQLASLTDITKIDYIVINHVEPDHSGAVVAIRKLAPQATILCSERARKMLDSFYGIQDGVQTVVDGETLSLGKHTLQFFSTPNVHWPETMMTYEQSERILFSCDAFGGYGVISETIFDDECSDLAYNESEALRYFANILPNYSRMVLKAIDRLSSLQIDIVAPSHGLVWRKEPARIIQNYKHWAEYAENGGETRIAVIYGSMYGNTTRLMESVVAGVRQENVAVEAMDVARTELSYILPHLLSSRGILVSAPTYDGQMFPPMTAVLQMVQIKRMFNKKVARVGSYGWGGGANRTFETFLPELKWDLIDSLDFVGVPKPADLQNAVELGARFARAIKG
jgi:anaerobic nitric oxide reductase flavorubredoxin